MGSCGSLGEALCIQDAVCTLESSISQVEELLHVDGHRPPYGRAKRQWLNGGERVREKDLCRSPGASLYNLSEIAVDKTAFM